MGSIEAIIDRQLRKWELEKRTRREAEQKGEKPIIKPIVTISRQRGSQGRHIAAKLAEKLGYDFLHKEVIDKICESTGYRRQVIESLDDRIRHSIELWFEGMFKGPYIDTSDYFRHLYRVIMSIAEHGGVVVVGRCANFIVAADQGFHVRIVCSYSRRIETLVKYQGFTPEDAEQEIKEFDRSRADLVRRNFHRDINDPMAYDMILNTTYMDSEGAISLIEEGIRAKMLTGNRILK